MRLQKLHNKNGANYAANPPKAADLPFHRGLGERKKRIPRCLVERINYCWWSERVHFVVKKDIFLFQVSSLVCFVFLLLKANQIEMSDDLCLLCALTMGTDDDDDICIAVKAPKVRVQACRYFPADGVTDVQNKTGIKLGS